MTFDKLRFQRALEIDRILNNNPRLDAFDYTRGLAWGGWGSSKTHDAFISIGDKCPMPQTTKSPSD